METEPIQLTSVLIVEDDSAMQARLRALMRKLAVKSRTAAVHEARTLGLLE